MLIPTINKFVEDHLPSSINFSNKSKFIHDPLWGTIELYSYELCILDTPLFQRLRYIHQTGFAFQTYPSATHTRFEHTLGAVYIASRIATTLRNKFPKIVNEDAIFRVRLAALFHDIGHSAFSHSSEEIYQDMDDIKYIIKNDNLFQNKGAGEVLSYLILTSEAFRNYFDKLKKKYPKLKNTKIDHFATFILGKSNNINLFEANIISGPFDADKLDYFPRDGRASGIEISLDIERLIHCLEIAPIVKEDDSETKVNTLVMNRGGFNAAQQLLFARASLFATVYHHQKVRACDCMFKACISNLQNNKLTIVSNSSKNKDIHLDSAANFLYLNDMDFYSLVNNNDRELDHVKMIKNIFNRNLLKRTITISSYTIHNISKSETQRSRYGEFLNFRSKPNVLKQFVKKIYLKADISSPISDVWFDIPKKPSFDKAGQALINMASKKRTPKIEKLSNVIPIHAWVDTYEKFYAQSYLFGPQNKEERIRLAISTIKVFKSFKQDQLVKLGLELNSNAVAEDIRDDVKKVLNYNLPDE